jgi:GTPase
VVDGSIILAGTVVKGTVKKGQLLHIGPDLKGAFRAVEVKSIECLRVPVKVAKCGQVCTLAIRPLNYALEWLEKEPSAIRRGMVLVDSKSNPKAVYEFLLELTPYSNEREEFSIT